MHGYPSIETARAALDRGTMPGPWLIVQNPSGGHVIYHEQYRDRIPPAGFAIVDTHPGAAIVRRMEPQGEI